MHRARLLVAALVVTGCAQGMHRTLPGRASTSFPTLVLAAAGGAATKPAPNAERLTLAEAYQLAVARSERIALAQREITRAEIERRAAWDEMTPDVNLTANAILQKERKVGDNVLVPQNQIVGSASILQPVFRRGFFAAREAGNRGLASAQALRIREREQLARDVVESFVGVVRSRKLLELARTAVQRAKTQHDLAIARVKAGQALKNAELLAVIDLRRAELQEVTARREADAANITFARLVGQMPPTEMVLPPTPDMPTPEQAVALAKKRPDLRALELEVQAAAATANAAAGRRWWPRVDLEASAQLFSPEVLDNTYEWRVVGILTIPLLQGGREMTELALRRNETHVAQLQLEQQRKLVVEELDQAAIRVATATAAAELASKQVEAAREHYKLVDRQVRLGAITFLEVTNAQAVLVEAENAFEVASMDRVIAVYDFLFAVGALDLTTTSR